MPPLLVHASLEYSHSAWGGISSALDLLVMASGAAGHQVAVISIGPSDQAISIGQYGCLHVVGMPELNGTVLYRHPDRVQLALLASERMAGRLEEIRHGDEVYLSVHNDELVHLAKICSTRRWCRSRIAFVHGLARQEHLGREDLHRQQDDLLAVVTNVAVFSHGYAKTVHRFYPLLRHIKVVRPPLVFVAEEAAGRRELRIEKLVPGTLLAAGRSVPQKGFDILLRALQDIPPRSVAAAHLIMGHGDSGYEQECNSLALRTATDVTISPWTAREILMTAMVRAALAVVPSRFEPFGLLAVEAMAHNVPVIASSVGGLRELVTDGTVGWLVPAAEETGPDQKDLAATILAAISSPTRISSGAEHLRQWSVQDYLEDMAELLEM